MSAQMKSKAVTPPSTLRKSVGGSSISATARPGKSTAASPIPIDVPNGSLLSSDDLFERFRTIMSNLLDERLSTIIVETQELRREVSCLRDRVQELETDAGQRTVRELTSRTNDSPQQTPAEPERGTGVQSLASLVAEEVDRQARQDSAVVKGIPENVSGALPAVLSEILGEPEERIVSTQRIGRTPESEESDPRLVRVRFASAAVKQAIYDRRFKLKFGQAPIYFSHDLTPLQQRQRRRNLPMYKRLRAADIRCCIPYGEILNKDGLIMTEHEITSLLPSETE